MIRISPKAIIEVYRELKEETRRDIYWNNDTEYGAWSFLEKLLKELNAEELLKEVR